MADKTGLVSLAEAGIYKRLRARPSGGLNMDHQPPLSCLVDAYYQMDPSIHRFACALTAPLKRDMCKPVKRRKKNIHEEPDTRAGNDLVACAVPEEHHQNYLTTGRSHRAKRMRELITDKILKNDVVDTFKFTFLASSPEFIYIASSVEERGRLPKSMHPNVPDYCVVAFTNVLNTWEGVFTGIEPKPMTHDQKEVLLKWIKDGGY